jgi:hypothetical protein
VHVIELEKKRCEEFMTSKSTVVYFTLYRLLRKRQKAKNGLKVSKVM